MLKDPRSLPPKYSNLIGIQTPISSEVEKHWGSTSKFERRDICFSSIAVRGVTISLCCDRAVRFVDAAEFYQAVLCSVRSRESHADLNRGSPKLWGHTAR